MDGPGDDQTKRSKSDRERQISYDIAYTESKKNDTNELITKQKQSHRFRERTHGYGVGGRGGRVDWEFGTGMYTPLT